LTGWSSAPTARAIAELIQPAVIVSADGGAARQLTHGDFDHQGPPAFTADGSGTDRRNRRADADYDPLDSEIYRVDLADGAIHALTDRRGPDVIPCPRRTQAHRLSGLR